MHVFLNFFTSVVERSAPVVQKKGRFAAITFCGAEIEMIEIIFRLSVAAARIPLTLALSSFDLVKGAT
jgi:hypothetical protein